MLDAASIKQLTELGINYAELSAAISDQSEKPYPVVLKTGEITVGGAKLHIYDEDGHNGLKGRVKTEVLAQATELGVKAIAAKAGVDYKGNDPDKLLEAINTKLNLPVDDKIKEKDRDIATMRTNWEQEKVAREQAEARWKDREELDRDISYFPENRIKSVKEKTLRTELKEDGITFGEHEGKPAVFVNGEVKKNADLTLVDPKTFTAEHFKAKGWIAEAAPAGAPKKTFDTKGQPGEPAAAFDHTSTYERVTKKYGGWNDKAQAEYTESMLATTQTAQA
jgi:hypothetical protein